MSKTEGGSQLQREISQHRPFPSLAAEALLGILRTADVLRRGGEGTVAPHDITAQQYNVLRILRGAGPDGLPTLTIAERMIERAPGITRLLDRLEARGLVTRARCAEDRRQVLCHLTKTGAKLLAELEEPVKDATERSLAMLSQKQLRDLIALLDAVRAAQ